MSLASILNSYCHSSHGSSLQPSIRQPLPSPCRTESKTLKVKLQLGNDFDDHHAVDSSLMTSACICMGAGHLVRCHHRRMSSSVCRMAEYTGRMCMSSQQRPPAQEASVTS